MPPETVFRTPRQVLSVARVIAAELAEGDPTLPELELINAILDPMTSTIDLLDGDPTNPARIAAGEAMKRADRAQNIRRPHNLGTFDGYQEAAMQTAGSPDGPGSAHFGSWAGLLLSALGMAGEAGEFAEDVKKIMFHGHPIDLAQLDAEAGDVLWYIARYAEWRGGQGCLANLAMANIAKLGARYPDGFSPERSQNRGDEVTSKKGLGTMLDQAETDLEELQEATVALLECIYEGLGPKKGQRIFIKAFGILNEGCRKTILRAYDVVNGPEVPSNVVSFPRPPEVPSNVVSFPRPPEVVED